MVWFYTDILYLAWMSHVILLHLLYLLTSIPYFDLIRGFYTWSVLTSLIGFMAQIKVILVSSSTFLHKLMEILILHFCVAINYIFFLIKAKLIFYLYVVELQIYMDYALLSIDVESMKLLLSDLESGVRKFKSTLHKVKILLITLKTLLSKIPIIRTLVSTIVSFNKLINNVFSQFKSICTFCNKFDGIFDLLNQLSTGSIYEDGSNNIILSWKEKSEHQVKVSIMKINNSTINVFQKGLKAINGILKMIELYDLVVSDEIMSILGQLYVVAKGLGKLYKLINQIQLLYQIILISSQVLYCTIKFYKEINKTVRELCESLEFDCSNVSQFLTSCFEVEKNGQNVCSKIDDCIKKLGESANRSKCLGVRKELLNLYSKIIKIIILLKFYVGLMAMEILIFKNIILTLIEMTVSSVFIDELIKLILAIDGIDKAIPTLIFADNYLRAFYTIQLQNSLMIFALSSKLLFSQYIHQYYDVLLLNLDLINRLIWAIECYIHHLIVFKFTSVCLNSIYPLIVDQLKIIIEIYKVMISITHIMDKLNLINKTINKIKTVGDDMDITNWKESAAKIRHETQLISGEIGEIDSQVTKINEYLSSIYKSLGMLIYLESFLKVLISQVLTFIKKTNKANQMALGIGNDYYTGVVMSMMEPCNKQLKFILGYLLVMSAFMRSLINIVGETLKLIEMKKLWLSSLSKTIESSVDKINKGVVGMECAIEGVPRNFILCSTKHLSKNLINHQNLGIVEVDKQVVGLYSLSNLIDYKVVINRLYYSAKKIDQILQVIPNFYGCNCVFSFESSSNNSITLDNKYVHKIIEEMMNKPGDKFYEFLGLDKITTIRSLGIDQNHVCLCMIIKYLLYPQITNIIQILGLDLQVLSQLSRKFTSYSQLKSVAYESLKMIIIVIDILDLISNWVIKKYYYVTIIRPYEVDIKCFCCYHQDPKYHLILNTLLVISWLIENIWTMDTENLRMGIECLSNFSSEFDIIYKDNNIGWNRCKLYIYQIVINKYCCPNQNPPCDNKCCCVTCLIIILMSIYMRIIVKINNKLCPSKCPQIKERICCFLKLVCNSKNMDCKKLLDSCAKLFGVTIQDCCPKLLESCKQICNSISQNNCNLDEWLKNCVQKICVDNCCPGQQQCICKQIKEACEKLCETFKNGDVDGVLKCLVEGCKTGEGKCSKCNIVSYTINLMKKNMVLIECNMKHDIKFNSLTFGSVTRVALNKNIKSLYLCRNELCIRLVKSSYISHGTGSNNITDVTSVRNWGYDTYHEHHLTDNRISESDGYPHINTSDGTRYDKRNKMFKLVLSHY